MARQIRYQRGGLPLEADLCLLICSIFPEHSRIPIEDLVIYMMGLNSFEDVHDMFEARYRVHELIPIADDPELPHKAIDNIRLRREKDEYDNQYVKMLAGAHALAKSVATSYRLVFRRETILKTWSKTSWYKYCYGLSVVLKKVNKYPVYLECSKLAMLQLQYGEDSQSLPIDFFEGMKQLHVLSLDVPSLPQSLIVLRNLRTLCLKLIKSGDMAIIGVLANLEFLSICTSCLTDIPKEMERLGNLRLLDLRKMHLAHIPPGVLSKLFKLEELYLPLSFTRWGCRAKEEEDDYDEWESLKNDAEGRINANLSEIGTLSLNVLQINVPNALILPKKSLVFKNIRQFKILVPNNLKYQPLGKGSINELQLRGDAFDIKESGICDLMSRTEDLTLTRVRNLNNVNNLMYQLKDSDSRQLKKLIITKCEELECLLDMEDWMEHGSLWGLRILHLSMLSNLKEIWHGTRTRSHFEWFINLRQITIRFCHKLKYVFPLSFARRLKRLQIIEILDCNELEGIVYKNEVEDVNNEFYFFEELHLHSLPMLVGFLTQKDNPIVKVNDDTNESSKIKKVLHIKDKDALSHMKKYCAFPSKLTTRLIFLEKLTIAFCDAVKVIFSFEENHDTTWVLNSLKKLELYGLRNLMHIWYQIPSYITAFKNLQHLILLECNNIYLLSPKVAKLLVQLQKVQISRCEKMEEIVARDDEVVEAIINKIVFPQLKVLELHDMPNIRYFYSGIYAIELPSLLSLKLNQRNKMESFSSGSLNTPMLEIVRLNESLHSVMGDLNATIKRLKDEKL